MIFDVIVLAALLVSAIIAFFRGFIREVLTILGVVGGLAASWGAGPLLSPLVRGWMGVKEGETPEKLFDMIPYDIVADVLAYGSVFIIVVGLLSVASHFLSGWARAVGLGAVDRTLGVVFGLARGIIILGLLYLPIHVMVDPKTSDEWFKDSRTRFYIQGTADGMMKLLPESFREESGKKAEETADQMVKSTREKLQEMDVLRGEEPPAPPPAEEPDDGYQREQRQQMNDLFEDNYND